MGSTDDNEALHKIVLNIYKDFKKICDDNQLRYYAISGTTIGAFLWQNIIPWDDDMDITMPIEDYIKFISLCQHHLPKHLAFSEYIWFGSKLHDKRTTFTNLNYIHDPKRYNGVFIDIVPLIALPNDEVERINFINEIKTFQNYGILYDRYQDKEYGLQKLLKWRDSLAMRYCFGQTDYVMDFSDPRYVLSASGFIKPTITKFADTTIPISSNAENDLHIQYGNLQKYPPKNKRRSVHEQQSILDLHTPYKEYATKYKKLPTWIKKMFTEKNTNEGDYLKTLFYTRDLLSTSEQKIIAIEKQLKSQESEIKAYHKTLPKRAQRLAHKVDSLLKKKINNLK